MSLPEPAQDDIYAHAADLLSNLLANDSSTRQDLVVLAKALSRALDRTIATSAQQWNSSRSSLFQHLPPEILAQCGRWSAFNDRLTASHVSRHFRAVLLAEPTLWARIRVTPTQSFPIGLEKVQALLARSGAAPLDICFTRDCSRFEMQACWLHFHRLRSLELAQAIPPFALDCPMPMLETFHVSAATMNVRHAQIPALWAGDGTPRLRSLTLPNFELPNSNRPLRNVRHFSGSMAGDVDASRLFALFPRLRSLQLNNVKQGSRTPQGLAPESLREVSFITSPAVLSDFSEHIEPYGSRLLQRLTIGETRDLAPILRIFTSSHNSTWRLTVRFSIVRLTTVSADERNCEYVAKLDRDSALFAWDSVSNADFTRLTHLDVSLAMLGPLLHARFTMHNLHELIIGITDMYDSRVLQGRVRLSSGHTARLIAPSLHTVNVVATLRAYEGNTMHWFETKLPPLLQTHVEHDGVLEHLCYSGPVTQKPGRMQSFRPLARDVAINGVSVSLNAADDDGRASGNCVFGMSGGFDLWKHGSVQ